MFQPQPGLRSQAVTDSNAITTLFEFDDRAKPTLIDSPDTGQTSFAYDPGGKLSSITNPVGDKLNLIYDLEDRPTRINIPGQAQDITITYDQGRVLGIVDRSGTATFYRGKSGRIRPNRSTSWVKST